MVDIYRCAIGPQLHRIFARNRVEVSIKALYHCYKCKIYRFQRRFDTFSVRSEATVLLTHCFVDILLVSAVSC